MEETPQLGEPWRPGVRPREDPLLAAYFESKGGLMFTEFNVAAKMPGSRMRRLDGIRFPEPLGGLTGAFVSGSENRTLVEEMFRRCTVELIEVHRWGFYALGQVVGKRRLLEGHWAPKEIHSVLIVDNSKSPQYRPSEDPDPAAEWVFRDFGIRVVVL